MAAMVVTARPFTRRLRTEERASLPIGLVLGASVGAANAVLAHARDLGLGEQLDLLRSEQSGLLDDRDDD